MKKEREERIRLLRHAAREADMLGDFIRLVDYMQAEQLCGLALHTASDFLHELTVRRCRHGSAASAILRSLCC